VTSPSARRTLGTERHATLLSCEVVRTARSLQYPDSRITAIVFVAFPLTQWRRTAPRLQWRDRPGFAPGSWARACLLFRSGPRLPAAPSEYAGTDVPRCGVRSYMQGESKPPRRQASVSTRKGDGGTTRLGGGGQISKADTRVEAYGTIDELNTVIGVARARCTDPEICREIRAIQRELFVVGSAVSTRPEAKKPIPEIEKAMVSRLDELVERWEAEPEILRDWSLPGEYDGSAGFDVARAICRRAERANVRYVTAGGAIQPAVLEYLNRLSDVLWLAARVIEARAGVDARLRDDAHPGPPWSRAW
jgi:cob(I)alamin adenosyltransferase